MKHPSSRCCQAIGKRGLTLVALLILVSKNLQMATTVSEMSQFVDVLTVVEAKDQREISTAWENSNKSTVGKATQSFQDPILDEDDSFSFCLLTKDDNAIMNEWIAYHYHVLRLRHIIVALDPKSETSPKELLEAWKQNFGLNYTIWGDEDYMPDYFLRGQYDKVPQWLGRSDAKIVKAAQRRNESKVLDLFAELNNRSLRQATFLKHCARSFQDIPNRKWVAHIDTDEYLVMSPLSWKKDETNKRLSVSTLSKQVTTETISQPNYLVDLLISWSKTKMGKRVLPCLVIPRLYFGAIEGTSGTHSSLERLDRNGDKAVFLRDSMETIRWKYHANYTDRKRNKGPKAILDVSHLPKLDTSRPVHSIHRPDSGRCPSLEPAAAYLIRKYPIVANHYLGSWERYGSRVDSRRSKAIYDRRANVQDMHQDDWMDAWLKGFVREHGVNKVVRVLGQYMDLNRTTGASIPM